MKYATGLDFGAELCRALGIEPEKVADVRLYVGAGQVAEVVVTYFVLEEEGKELVDLVKRYALVPHPDQKPAIVPRLVLEEQPDV